jgi:hypothetical protein
LNTEIKKQLMEQRPAALQLSIPLSPTENIVCDLVSFELGNIKFTENNSDVIENVKIPVTYRGIVQGELQKNNVMFTVNEDYVSFTATFPDKNIHITQASETDNSLYRLNDSRKITVPEVPFVCGTSDVSTSAVVNEFHSSRRVERPSAPQDKCVLVFVECFDSLYQWQGRNSQQTINYVYSLFNAVATGYINEQVNIQILTVNIWTTADPYRGDTRENALNDLAATYKDSFWGNICVGLDYSMNGTDRGGIASIGKVKGVSPNTCKSYDVNSNAFCYNDLDYANVVTVKDFPGSAATGAAIYSVMHEIGHLLGSRHTKWCGWKLTSNPDTFGALDSCGARESTDTTKPLCPQGPPPPSSGATIMSYCVSSATSFVSFNAGFGTLPGNAVRNFVDETVCIPDCTTCTVSLNTRDTPLKFYDYNFNIAAKHHPPGKGAIMR